MAIWNAHTASDLTTALAGCALGDTINCDAGVEFTGNFTLPDKGAGTSYVTIQTTGTLPTGRVSPSDAGQMARITTANGSPVFNFVTASHHWKFIGLEISTTSAPLAAGQRVPFLVSGGGTFASPVHDIIFDRCLIHPYETDPVPARAAEEGFNLDGVNITWQKCYMYDFTGWEAGTATQTITAATNANPVVVTLSAGIPGSPPNGTTFLLYLKGGTGSWAGINNVTLATVTGSNTASLQSFDPTTFALSNINSTGWGSFSGQSISVMPTNASTNRDILIGNGPGPYTINNNFLEAYYSPIFTGGNDQTLIDPANQVTVTAVNSLTQVVLSSTGGSNPLQVGDLIAFGDTQDQTISGASNANPCVLTVQAHNYPAGTALTPEGCITVSGGTGAWAAINGSWSSNGNGCGTGWAIVIDSTHISIPVDSTGFGTFTATSPKWVLKTKNNGGGHTQWVVGKVTNISGNTVDYTWWGHQPQNVGGNGAGILIKVGSPAQFRGTVLGNITVTNNTIGTRRYWIRLYRDKAGTSFASTGQVPKAIWESKQANNVTITGNTFQIFGGFSDVPGTVCLAPNQANQIGATPWVTNNNWLVRSNLFLGYTYMKIGQTEEYETGAVSSGFTLDNNLMTPGDCSGFALEGGDSVTITHNTVRNTGGGATCGASMWILVDGPETNSIVRDNIGLWNVGGYVICPGGSCSGWTPAACNHNYLIGGDTGSSGWQSGDVAVANDAAMGFTNITSADAGGDYHGYQLTGGSIGHNAASDGKDVGVDFVLLDAALSTGPVICKFNRSPICQ